MLRPVLVWQAADWDSFAGGSQPSGDWSSGWLCFHYKSVSDGSDIMRPHPLSRSVFARKNTCLWLSLLGVVFPSISPHIVKPRMSDNVWTLTEMYEAWTGVKETKEWTTMDHGYTLLSLWKIDICKKRKAFHEPSSSARMMDSSYYCPSFILWSNRP